MRGTTRHNTSIPVDLQINGKGAQLSSLRVANISAGGLGIYAPSAVATGTPVTLNFCDTWPDYVIRGDVAWCLDEPQGYHLGIEFQHANEAFKARMLAQFGQIQRYRSSVRQNEGRRLTTDQAAREWIDLYAEAFEQTVGWR